MELPNNQVIFDQVVRNEGVIFRRLKQYFNTRAHDVFVFRFYSLLVIFFVPVFGFVLASVKPDATEYLSHRFMISIYDIGLLGDNFDFIV